MLLFRWMVRPMVRAREILTVTQFLAELPDGFRPVVKKLRAAVRKIAPGAKKSVQSGAAAYYLADGMLCAFKMQKGYLGVYFCQAHDRTVIL